MPTSGEAITGGMFVCRPERIVYKTGQVIGFTLLSDLHIGAAHVDYDLIKKELKTAKDHGDRIAVNGDIFDMILTKDHKRFIPDVLHPRLQGNRNIVNGAIEWAAEIFAPVAEQIDMIGFGNHEASVERLNSFDPISALIHELEKLLPAKSKHVIHYGGYCGYIDWRFERVRQAPIRERNGKRFVVFYHHGSGAAAPVTKGMIDFARRDTWVDADVIWLGHKHNRWNASVEKVSCPLTGDHPLVKNCRHVMTGAYFDTYRGQSQAHVREHGRRSNYAADLGLAPSGRGGARIELVFRNHQAPYEVRVIQ